MRTKPKYSHESVQRALVNHEARGVIRTWSPPEQGQRTYRVNLYDYGHWEGTLGETHALVVGIRVQQVFEERLHEST
jgi:hypothetical protein